MKKSGKTRKYIFFNVLSLFASYLANSTGNPPEIRGCLWDVSGQFPLGHHCWAARYIRKCLLKCFYLVWAKKYKKIQSALENIALVCPICFVAVAQWPNNNKINFYMIIYGKNFDTKIYILLQNTLKDFLKRFTVL